MSSTSNTPSRTGRRMRQGFLALAMVVATTVSAVLATMIAEKKSVRFDVTQTRMHQLADRTEAILKNLDGSYEIVLAFNTRATNQYGQLRVDRRARERTDDVLQGMLSTQPRLKVTSIDTGSIDGEAAYRSLLERLIEREKSAIDYHAETTRGAAADLGRIGNLVGESIIAQMRQLAASIVVNDQPTQANRDAIEDLANRLAQVAQQMVLRASEHAETLTDPATGDVWLPESDAVIAVLSLQLKSAAANLDFLANEFNELGTGDSGLSPATRGEAKNLATRFSSLGDELLIQADVVERLLPVDLHRIRNTITTGEVVLVIGPPENGVTAVEFGAIFPAGHVIDQTTGLQSDLRRRAEEMLASALGVVSSDARPIVVIAHAEPISGLENPALFGIAAGRLELRGIDVIEWAVSLEPTIPNLGSIDPDGVRPIVWVFHDTESWSTVSDERLSGPAKAANLGKAMESVLDRGDAMLISTNPSILPGYGQPDPTISVLNAFGLKATSGRALMREFASGAQRALAPDGFLVQVEETEHPITSAVSGLPMWMSWPVSIGAGEPVTGSKWWPLAVVEARVGERVWGESQWAGMRQTPANQRHMMSSPPQFDEGRDDEAGRWVVAAAAERASPNGIGRQRLVYVGTNGWFLGNVISSRQNIDGRVVPTFPGNAELLESSIYWLANQDHLIGRSATAQATPLVQVLSTSQLRVINLMLIVVLPLLVLVSGVVWRVVRG